ncbi:MAG: hypothetical protein ABIG39_07520 [Candidatus Micrarchaeota archaeon]
MLKPIRKARPQEGIEVIDGKTYAVRWEGGKVAEIYGLVIASYEPNDKNLAKFNAKRDPAFEVFTLFNNHNYVIDTSKNGGGQSL